MSAHRRSIEHAEDRRAFGTDRVHDGAHVAHSNLEWSSGIRRVRHPGATLIEVDQPCEGRNAFEECTEERHFPRELDVRRGARDKHIVEGPFARHAVSDVDVAAARVSNLGDHVRIVLRAHSRGGGRERRALMSSGTRQTPLTSRMRPDG